MLEYRKVLLGAAALSLVMGGALLFWRGPATEASYNYPDPSTAAQAKSDDAGSIWGADYFPNVELITHEGKKVRFFDDLIEDKVVAINFIYTTCPDACPMETARLKEVQDLLGERMGRDVFFYSVTIDPENDTPEVLGEYVKNWQIGPGWTFLTGSEEDIVRLRQKLGIYIEEIQAEDSNDHNLSLVIGNQATGRWMKRSPYENPYILASQLGDWLHNWKMPRKNDRSYEDAPELRRISTGELLFRTRCASCHTVGGGDVAQDARRVGPDLFGVVEQRDPEWLERWLMEPDRMLEEGDPLATSLFEQYNRVPMPNLRLTETDVDNVLAYIEEETRIIADLRTQSQQHSQMAMASHEGHEGHEGHGDHAGHGDHGGHAGHQGHEGQTGHEGQAGHEGHTGHEGHAGHGGAHADHAADGEHAGGHDHSDTTADATHGAHTGEM